ncbi:MAG TPA: heme utilization cystosolic carrier protein HutX [Rhizobiales bacterium]|nr:heme utilization cystosolic carrier protein HutX [Hyphomicrobiales bacterium]
MNSLSTEKKQAIQTSLSENPGAVLDYVAKEHEVSALDIIHCLPEHQTRLVDGALFETVMLEVSDWGDITFLVHTEDLILEAKGSVPKGKSARGFYNLHGAPIGGHLKGENCDAIAFVSRPLFSSDTKSVQFFNKKGGCMFKIYLGRDENRQMLSSQIEAFEALKSKLGSS